MTRRRTDAHAVAGVTGTARGRLLAELCGSPLTALELAARVHTSSNAVRVHLQALRRAGLVQYHVERRGVGKPRHVYTLTFAAEYLLSSAYAPALRAIVDTLRAQADGAAATLLRDAGAALAVERDPGSDGEPKVQAGVRLLRALGGSPRLERREDEAVLHSDCCPLGAVTRATPELCFLLEGAIATATGAPARQRCERGAHPHCAFVLTLAGSPGRERPKQDPKARGARS